MPKVEKIEKTQALEPPEVRRWLRVADEVLGKKGGGRVIDEHPRSPLQDYELRVREVALAQLKRSR